MLPYGALLAQMASIKMPAPDIAQEEASDSPVVKSIKQLVRKMVGYDRKSRMKMPDVEKELQTLVGASHF